MALDLFLERHQKVLPFLQLELSEVKASFLPITSNMDGEPSPNPAWGAQGFSFSSSKERRAHLGCSVMLTAYRT